MNYLFSIVKISVLIVTIISPVKCWSSSASRGLFMRSLLVIGANGRTGRKVVNVALKKGWQVNAITRSGNYFDNDVAVSSKNLVSIAGDVTKLSSTLSEELQKAIKSSSAIIFAASASKEGGKPNEVDKQGVINVAKLCIENKIPRLVIISSGAVTKPLSPVYLFLNLFGGIMKAKIEGENEVRRLYNSPEAKGLGYTIIRPGGLTEDPPRGVNAIELNQGDDMSGRISRWDVAAICVESIDSKDADKVTLEAYYQDSGQPLANVGLSNLLKMTKENDSERKRTGRERRGNTWSKLFQGLTPDFSN